MNRKNPCVRAFIASAVVAAVVVAGNTAPTGSTIPIGASHGGLHDGSGGAPIALGTGTFVIAAEGLDGLMTTADDEMLLVTGAGGGSPVVTGIAAPGQTNYSGQPLRLSATRMAVVGAGPDLVWSTSDDLVTIIDRIGSTNTVTSITVGGLGDSDRHAPIALSTDSFAMYSFGADNSEKTADDEIVVVTLGGVTPVVQHLAAPYIEKSGRSQPVTLHPDSFLVASNGPDGNAKTADDVVYLFTDVHGTPVRTDLAVPYLYRRTGRPVRVDARRAVVAASGPDGVNGTADDVIWLLDDLGGENTTTSITTGSQFDFGAGPPTVLDDDLVVIASNGTDLSDGTEDDSVVVVSGLGTTNTVTTVAIGALDEDGECRPVRMGPTSFSLVSFGADNNSGTADDEVVLLTDAGGANTLTRIAIPGLMGGITSKVVSLSPDSLLVMTGGSDAISGTSDDAVVLVTNAFGTPVVEAVGFDTGANINNDYGLEYVPVLLGGGLAIHFTPGADDSDGTTDDGIRVLSGLPETRSLFVKSAKIGFKADKPEKGAKGVFKGTLNLADDGGIRDDVTISLGNASTTIPHAAFKVKKGSWKYKAPKGSPGFVTAMSYSQKKGAFSVKAKGVASGAETTDAGHLALSFESGDAFFGQVVVGTAYKGGIKYKAPK